MNTPLDPAAARMQAIHLGSWLGRQAASLIHKPYDAVRFAGRFLRPLSRDLTRPRMVWK